MAGKWEAKPFNLSDINGGNRYENGTSPDADAINAAIEGASYAASVSDSAKEEAGQAKSTATSAESSAAAAQEAAVVAQEAASSSLAYQEETREQISYLAKKISNIQEGLPNMPFVVDETTAYEKKVPANALPYAYIGDICGRTITPTDANYFDVSKVTSEFGDMYVQDGVVYVNNPQGTMTQLTLKQICPDIEVGKTYRISCKTNYNGSSIQFGGISVGGNSYATFTATDAILNSQVEFYPEYTFENQAGADEYKEIMVSSGTYSKSFVPYIKLVSKNLFDISAAKALEQTYDITVNTAPNVASIKLNYFGNFSLPLSLIVADFAVGETYTLSFNRKSETYYVVGITGGTIVTTNGRDQDSGDTSITFIVNSAGASLDFTPNVDVGGDPFFGERFMLSEGSYAESYVQFGKWADAKVTRIESLDKNGNVINTLNLANLQGLEAYGKGSAGRYNTVSFGVYEPYARYIQRTSKYNQSIYPEITTDISNLISPYENIILVSPNGKVVAVNENKIPVKFVVGYQTEE
jgi:hypothetical protein